jgi:hypothetical protein
MLSFKWLAINIAINVTASRGFHCSGFESYKLNHAYEADYRSYIVHSFQIIPHGYDIELLIKYCHWTLLKPVVCSSFLVRKKDE